MNDRASIASLSNAANGQGSSPVENKKKRRREDERSNNNRHRPYSFRGNIFDQLSQDNLGSSSRPKPGIPGLDVSGASPTPPRNRQPDRSLAHYVFPSPTNSSRSCLPGERSVKRDAALIEVDGGPTDAGTIRNHAVDRNHSRPSEDMDRRMSGSGEENVPFTVFLNSTDEPHQIKEEPPQSNSNNHETSSSSDPIDVIGSKTPFGERQPARTKTKIKTNQVEHINIEDDEDDEKAIEKMIKPEGQPPSTPTGKTPFQPGNVKKKIKAKENSSIQQSLGSYSVSQPSGGRSSAQRSGASSPQSKNSTQSKPVIITPGCTRGSGVGKAMKSDQSKVKAGLGVHKTGEEARAQKPVSKSGTRDASRSQVPKPTPASSGELVLKVLEWFCGNKRYGNDQPGGQHHRFHCGSGTISLQAEPPTPPLVLLPSDLRGFEVVESSNKSSDVEEFVPVVQLNVTALCTRSPAWEKLSDGDNYPSVLIVFDFADEVDGNKWRRMVDILNRSAKKSTVNAIAMNGLINHARSLSKGQLQSTSSKARPRTKPEPKPKPGETNGDIVKQPSPAVVPPTMPGPSTRTRNRTGAIQSKDEPPTIKLEYEGLDEVMLVYPAAGPGAVNINRAELSRLEDNEFLNDTLIELGLKLWLNELREKSPDLADQIHVFNSFFFKKLDAGRGRCDYNSVKKWTSKIDLFKKKFIIVPINEHLHWYLAIIFLPQYALDAPPPQPAPQPTRKTRSNNAGNSNIDQVQTSQESDTLPAERYSIVDVEAGSPLELGQMEIDTDLANRSQQSMVLHDVTMVDAINDADPKPSERPTTPVLDVEDEEFRIEDQNTISEQKCWILIFDSLKGKHTRTVRILREYLQMEAQEKHRALIETKDAKLSGGFIEDKHLPVPEQPNWCDCGVYLLHYVEAFVSNPLELLVLPGRRRKSLPEEVARYKELWRTRDVVKKRETFRKQVHDLSEAWLRSKSQSAQVLKSGPPLTGVLPSDTDLAPPLASVAGEASLIEIEPPDIRVSSNERVSSPEREYLTRTGVLPSTPDPHPNLPPNPLLHPPLERDEELSIIEVSSVGNETRNSDEASSLAGHKTRRGKKGGERHQHPDTYWVSRGTQQSQAQKSPEVSHMTSTFSISNLPESPDL